MDGTRMLLVDVPRKYRSSMLLSYGEGLVIHGSKLVARAIDHSWLPILSVLNAVNSNRTDSSISPGF
ncbi:uncharacterized protein MYCFIDRAFT_171658 [Pseudocercospora fijiensis CIRAD86]|uniref:Uncharacterized protein n=1 Tax=Pseudocercospora fijiensis (strain CIRAD86) TaxID=383855 RepID=M3AMJ0_PSEFD|nr:uncharacterized protein MYCFIDRAFT_171658 [Pseudocercospora fijiensis CIRAD86]EME85781.1 hypothetical protein MYCFIDRAFT_171658 [Pseudocercospora fijiensis CIRAD86]